MTAFTLIELVITIALVVLLALSAGPALNYMLSYSELTSSSNQFRSVLQFARSEAVRRGGQVFVSVVDNGATVDSDNEFGGGLVAWVDSDSDGGIDAGEELQYYTDTGGLTIDAEPDFTLLAFNSDGRVWGAGLAEYNFEFCRSGESEGYALKIKARASGVLVEQKTDCPTT